MIEATKRQLKSMIDSTTITRNLHSGFGVPSRSCLKKFLLVWLSIRRSMTITDKYGLFYYFHIINNIIYLIIEHLMHIYLTVN